MNVIRLHTHLAKIVVAVMLWTGLAGPLAVVHARQLNLAASASTEMMKHAQHITEHADHGHNGGMASSDDGAPISDPDCLKFCAELLDSPAVLTVLFERPSIDFDKNLILALGERHFADAVLIPASSVSATGPPFGRDFDLQHYASGLGALLARNNRLRI